MLICPDGVNTSRKKILRLSLLTLTLTGLFFAIPVVPVRAQTTFLSAVPIDTNNGYNSNFPSAMVASDGTIWLAWDSDLYSNLTTREDIFYQFKTPGGLWNDPQNLTKTGQNISPALVQLTNSTVLLLWSAQPSSNACSPACNIYYAKHNGAWSKPVRFTNGNYNDTSISAVVDRAGTLWIFWTRTITSCSVNPCSTTRQIHYRTSQGNTMSPDTLLINDPSNAYYQPSALVQRDGTVRVVFTKANQSTASQLYSVTFTGTGWTSPVAILPSSSPLPSGDFDSLPSIIQDRNGTIWVFWTRTLSLSSTLTQDVILGSFSYSNGASFAAPSQLTSDSTTTPIDDHMPAAVQGPDKNIWVYYISDLTSNGGEWDIYALQSSRPISPVNNLAVSSIKTNNSLVFPKYLKDVPQSPVVTISVTVANLGDALNEAFTLQATAINSSSYPLGTVSTTITNGTSRMFQFLWDTTKVRLSAYSIQATVTPLLSETVGNSGDSSLTLKNLLRVLPLGDVDMDGAINIIDAGVVLRWFGNPVSAYYLLPYADVDNAGVIDIIDAGVVEAHFGLVT